MNIYTTIRSWTNITCAICIGLFVVTSTPALVQAQDTLDVEQGVGTLNEAIKSDTTESGERENPNRVYRLQSGGIYLLNGSIENRDYHLQIVAEKGSSERPRLIPAADDEGNSSRAIRTRGDITLKGLYITNMAENEVVNKNTIRASADGIRIWLEDCYVEHESQSIFRLDSEGMKVYVYNSIIANSGFTSDPNNGRVIDTRGNDVDSIVVENSTMFNITSRALRPGGGLIKYAEFNHNTFVNFGQGVVHFDETLNAKFTNNMVVNSPFYGVENNEEEPTPAVRIDSTFGDEGLMTESVIVSNNNFHYDQAVLDAYPSDIQAAPIFDEETLSFIEDNDDNETIYSEVITFTDGPDDPSEVVQVWYNDPDGTQPEFDKEGQADFDFSYSTSADAYTRSVDGQPLGDLNWFGMSPVSNEREIVTNQPDGFKLNGNYPNPFNPSTNISFNLPKGAAVSIDVFSVIGQKVLSIPAQQMSAGTDLNVRIDASSLTSGMYIYRVTA
ncbi:MAG: T9SS type A sorting domain-containing protein, partial [Gracilimonas sp.]